MRKTQIYQVADESRDKGKRFLLTEMPAMKAEKWALRALLALAKSGVDLSEEQQAAGMAGLAMAGLKALHSLEFKDAAPLLDEMWDCVQVISDPKHPDVTRPLMMRGLEGDDVEELTTIWRLREMILKLHVDFFLQGQPSRTISDSSTTRSRGSKTTPTSPARSER